jgi:hypothetical protein
MHFLKMTIGTGVAKLAELDKNFKLDVVGMIPKGFPDISIPKVWMIDVIPDAIIISLVTFATSELYFLFGN